MNRPSSFEIVTVTLNPALDQTISISDFAPGQVNRVESSVTVAGGKGVNVASVLADAGHGVAATGFLGRDNPTLFEGLCARKNIGEYFVHLEGATRIGIKITDPHGETTDINFPGLAPSEQELADFHVKIADLEAPWFVLAGSLPPGTPVEFYRDLTRILKLQGRKVALDTSGEALKLALEASPDLIKPNIHELEEMTKQTLDGLESIASAARELLGRGIETVAVSMGEQGAIVVRQDQVVLARPPQVEVKSTVGAGDAMMAGLLAAQLRGLSLEASARLATAFSLDALMHLEAGLSPSAVIDALAAQVEIEVLHF
jgi:1-phosphofructokinase